MEINNGFNKSEALVNPTQEANQETTQESEEKSGEKIERGDNEKKILDLIESNPEITINILAEKLNIGLTTVENSLGRLKKSIRSLV